MERRTTYNVCKGSEITGAVLANLSLISLLPGLFSDGVDPQ